MFSKIKEFLGGTGSLEVDAEGVVTSEDLQLATAVLLLEMAGQDEDYAEQEIHSIADALKKQFQIANDSILNFLETAQLRREKAGKIDSFVEQINAQFSDKQKQTVLAMLWRVVLADGSVGKFEERFTTQMRYRLKLTDEQVSEAKRMAQQGLV